MKSFVFVVLLILLFFGFYPNASFAIENPSAVPNNKFGIHILFPSELQEATRLVNSSGGDWGYVTIPIQAKDKNLEKWQEFMNEARMLHLIPILRLATEGDYFNTSVWKKPSFEDVLDFANFLSSLDWPTKNRYIVVFNEPNRFDEWVGEVNPAEYAEILQYAVDVFKSRSEDYFIISAGMDNAAANVSGKYMNQYDFMTKMDETVPGIFGLIDGLGSHSYPNPAFKQPPTVLTRQSIYSFNFEKDLAYSLSKKKLPVFITETGWSENFLDQIQISSYFIDAFNSVWGDSSIVAITPFLLQAGNGPFAQFSLIKDSAKSKTHEVLEKMPKIKGEPKLNEVKIIEDNRKPKSKEVIDEAKKFAAENLYNYSSLHIPKSVINIAKWFLNL